MTLRPSNPKHLVLVAAFALAAVLPILLFGIPGGNDRVQHYEFASQVYEAVSAGYCFPSFAGISNHGFGDTGLRVYPPLAYYALAGGFALFGSWFAASVAVFFAVFWVGGYGVYMWARELFGEPEALIASAIFIFAPFHLNEIYNNFLYAEFAASAVLPYCFLYVHRACTHGSFKVGLQLSVCSAILIITHLPMAILGSIAVMLYGAVVSGKDLPRRAPRLAVALAGTLVLSSFYWVRLVTEAGLIKHSRPEYFSSIWDFRQNFLLSPARWLDPAGDSLSLWLGDLMLAAIVLICLPTTFRFLWLKREHSGLLPVSSVLMFAVLMALPVSAVLWEYLPLLQKVQFPWRWLGIITPLAAVFASAGIARLISVDGEYRSILGSSILAAAVLLFSVTSAFIMKAPDFTPPRDFDEIAKGFPSGETFEGWWPATADRAAFNLAGKAEAGDRSVEIIEWRQQERTVAVESGAATDLVLATFHYPHWTATVNGNPAPVSGDPRGLTTVPIPEARSVVTVRFQEPWIVKAGALASLAGWLSLIVFGVFSSVCLAPRARAAAS